MNPDKTLRLSSYTIQVELNDRKNQVLLIHGYTGAVDIVSKELASTLNHCNQLPECFTCTLCFTCGEFL